MDAAFHGLTIKPFQLVTAPAFDFDGKQFRRAVACLEFDAARHGAQLAQQEGT